MALKVVTNEGFRPVKAIPFADAVQTEFTGGDLIASIVVDALTPIKAKDGGILLVMTCTHSNWKARGITGIDKAFSVIAPELWQATPIIISLRGKPTTTWDFTIKGKVELPVLSYEQWAIKYILDNDLIGKEFAGRLTLDSDDEPTPPLFKGDWKDIESEPLIAISKAYESSVESSKGGYTPRPEKTYQQKTDEKLAVVANLAWRILYPEKDYQASGDLPKVAVDLVQQINESKQMEVLRLLLP